jgi:hypothetical protein
LNEFKNELKKKSTNISPEQLEIETKYYDVKYLYRDVRNLIDMIYDNELKDIFKVWKLTAPKYLDDSDKLSRIRTPEKYYSLLESLPV